MTRSVCPKCGYAGALRLDHGEISARPTGSQHHGQRYCLRCQEWILPMSPDDFDRKYHLVRD
jgi:hypothetical protein